MIESSLEIGGAVVFWAAAEFTDRRRLQSAFDGLGLGPLVPEPRPDAAVLRQALEEVHGGPKVLVRPLAGRDGFAVVAEDRGSAANRYDTLLVARVAGSPTSLTFEPPSPRDGEVRSAFGRHLGRVPAAQLSSCLVRVVESLGGTRLRPTGAVYWVPGHKLAEWADVAAAVEGAGEGRPSAVYVLRHRFDADAIRAVRDAVVAEVRTEAGRIRDDVLAGDLGGRALETRQRLAGALRDKVLLYEDLLSVGLADLHAVVDAADQATASAALLLGASTDHSSRRPVAVG